MEFQMEDHPSPAALWEMLKLVQIMSFLASYYSMKVLGFYKMVVMLTGIGLYWGRIYFRILDIDS